MSSVLSRGHEVLDVTVHPDGSVHWRARFTLSSGRVFEQAYHLHKEVPRDAQGQPIADYSPVARAALLAGEAARAVQLDAARVLAELDPLEPEVKPQPEAELDPLEPEPQPEAEPAPPGEQRPMAPPPGPPPRKRSRWPLALLVLVIVVATMLSALRASGRRPLPQQHDAPAAPAAAPPDDIELAPDPSTDPTDPTVSP